MHWSGIGPWLCRSNTPWGQMMDYMAVLLYAAKQQLHKLLIQISDDQGANCGTHRGCQMMITEQGKGHQTHVHAVNMQSCTTAKRFLRRFQLVCLYLQHAIGAASGSVTDRAAKLLLCILVILVSVN